MIPWNPHRFTTGQMDVERLNDNLERLASDITSSMSRRYTYSTAIFPLEGLTNASTAAERSFVMRRFTPPSSPELGNHDVVFIDLVLYASGAATWSIACSDTSWPGFSVVTVDDTTEARGVSNAVVPITDDGAGTTFTVSASGASTIAAGYIAVTYRADRGSQGASLTPYVPTLLSAASSTAGSLLDTELTAAAAAVALDTAADEDLRVEIFRVRNLGAGSSVSWQMPSGARRIAGYAMGVVAGAGNSLTLTAGGVGLGTAPGLGTTLTQTLVADVGGAFSVADDPMDATDDTTVTLSASVGTVSIGYVSLFWS